MVTVRSKDGIDVKAPAPVVYDLITEQMLEKHDDAEEMHQRRPLDDGPVRSGFRWEQTVVHNRNECRTEWVVTRAQRPTLLEGSFVHHCNLVGRESRGGDRWEIDGSGSSTYVALTTWRNRIGLRGVLLKWFGNPSDMMALRKRLAYVQFEAERRVAAARTD